MEACSSRKSSSSEYIDGDHDNRNYGLPPAFSTTSPLNSEIPERLLQDDAPSLSPSHGEQSTLSRHNSLQGAAYSPQEDAPPQQAPSRQGQVHFHRHQDTEDESEHVPESTTALCQKWNHAEEGQDVRKALRKPHSWKEKLGTFSMIGLSAGFVLLCAAVGTLVFIWFGSPAIPAWKEITARNWLSKAISICIGVIQQVMMLQLGIVTATLASLALESRDVVIGDLASVSAMRATAPSTGAFIMAWQYLSGGSYRSARHSNNVFPIFSATLLWCLSQFLLLIILTDVSLRSTAGLASPASLAYSLNYNVTTSTDGTDTVTSKFQYPSFGAWSSKISKYASFAEYSEPPYEADGVSDTGVTLRAFLPFSTAQDREKLESYEGKSTVLDARVTCQVPQIKNATVSYELRLQKSLTATQSTVDFGLRVRGSLTATKDTPRLANLTLPDGSKDFQCAFTSGPNYKNITQWGLSLCQLWNNDGFKVGRTFGGLYSEFQDPSLIGGSDFQGSAYLFLNNTLGNYDDLGWFYRNSSSGSMVAEASQERGEWLDLFYSNGSFILSASICYAAFDFANIDVSISSHSNRTESRLDAVFDQDTSTYTFHELRYAVGQDRSLSIDKRGMLELAKGTWQVTPDGKVLESQVSSSSDLRMPADLLFTTFENWGGRHSFITGTLHQSGYCGVEDACVIPETMHEILKTNGSIAFALQTMITLLSSMAYYDQMDHFDEWTLAELTFFETAQVPVGYIGLAIVMITVAAHCSLVVYCVSLFIRKTTLSRLGASWSAVAQVATGDVTEYLGHATLAGDNDFEARLKADGRGSTKVCLEENDGQVSVSILGKDKEK